MLVEIACVCTGSLPNCQKCHGSGKVVKPACGRCHGKGTELGVDRKCFDCKGLGFRDWFTDTNGVIAL